MSTKILKLINFKSIADRTFEIPDNTKIAVFVGQNESGKSTAMQAIETQMILKGFVKSPVKLGEKEAKIEYSGTDLEGNPIKIITDINENGEYEFTAGTIVGNKVKTIHDVKKIKELIGVYYPLTVHEVLSMVKYTEGRRKFINDYLLPLLTESQRTRLAELQLSISNSKSKTTEGNLYNRRTQLNKDIEALNIEIKAQGITPEEQLELNKKQLVIDAIAKLELELEPHKEDAATRIRIETEIHYIKNKIQNLFDIVEDFSTQYNFKIPLVKDTFDELVKNRETQLTTLWSKEQIQAYEDNISKGKAKKTTLEGYEKRTTSDTVKIAERDKKFVEVSEIGQQIEKNRLEIKTIYSNSNLPAGIEIDENGENIMLNGFLLDESTNSETEAHLAIIELLCNISTNKWINIGDLSLYDKLSQNKIIQLAEKHGRIMMAQLVSEDPTVSLKIIVSNK
jgi:hypothetical protein